MIQNDPKMTCQENASSNDWLVYLAGGGWCYDLESCEGRFNGSLFPHQACSSSTQSKPCFMSSKDRWWVMVVENDLPPKWMIYCFLQWKLLLESCWMNMMRLIRRLAFSLQMWQDYPPACGKSLGSFSSLPWSAGLTCCRRPEFPVGLKVAWFSSMPCCPDSQSGFSGHILEIILQVGVGSFFDICTYI